MITPFSDFKQEVVRQYPINWWCELVVFHLCAF